MTCLVPNSPRQYTPNVSPLYNFKKGTTFVHINAQSLIPKLDEIKYGLSNPKIQVLSVNETGLNDSIEDQEISIPRFSLFRHYRTYGRHGGVALYVCNELQPSLMSDLFDSDVESVFVRIHIGNSPCIVGSIYRVLPTLI